MKLSVPRLMNLPLKSEPPIPFDRPKTEAKGKYLVQTFKCCTTPADPGLPTYKVAMPYFSNGNLESWIQFQKCLGRVFSGQGDTTGPNKYTKLLQLLQGNFSGFGNTHALSSQTYQDE